MPEPRQTGPGPWTWLKRRFRRLTVSLLDRYVRWRGRRGLVAIQRDGERLGRLRHVATPLRRRKLVTQIARVMGPGTGSAEVRGWLRQAYQTNDRAALEVMAQACSAIPQREIVDSVDITGAEALLARAESGQGAVLMGMHAGNVFALLLALDRLGVPITVVAYEAHKLPSAFFHKVFRDSGVKVVDARPEFAAFYHLDKALKRGRMTFIAIDQINRQGGIPTRFLGKQVDMPPGVATLAKKYDVPVFPVLLDAAEPRWTFRISEAIQLPEGDSTDQDVAKLADIVDCHIRAHPELWSWHQRRWLRYPFPEEGK